MVFSDFFVYFKYSDCVSVKGKTLRATLPAKLKSWKTSTVLATCRGFLVQTTWRALKSLLEHWLEYVIYIYIIYIYVILNYINWRAMPSGLLHWGDESGWKQVNGDVFRKPDHLAIFTVVYASGCHLACTVFIVLIFAICNSCLVAMKDICLQWLRLQNGERNKFKQTLLAHLGFLVRSCHCGALRGTMLHGGQRQAPS